MLLTTFNIYKLKLNVRHLRWMPDSPAAKFLSLDLEYRLWCNPKHRGHSRPSWCSCSHVLSLPEWDLWGEREREWCYMYHEHRNITVWPYVRNRLILTTSPSAHTHTHPYMLSMYTVPVSQVYQLSPFRFPAIFSVSRKKQVVLCNWPWTSPWKCPPAYSLIIFLHPTSFDAMNPH